MAETLPNLTYGTVTGRFLAAVADSVDDLDKNPDGVPLSGTVKFTPSVSALLLTSSNPPITVLPAAITATLDAEGYISLNGERGVNLIATDTMDTSPTEFTYEVSFQNIRYAGGANIPYPNFSIQVPADVVTDLTLTSPVPSSTGAPVVRDENAVWTAANTATAKALEAEAAAEDAHTVLAQMTDGTFSGVSLDASSSTGQLLTITDYTVITFDTVKTDTLGAFNKATGIYTIPITGTWSLSGSARIGDGTLPQGANVGIGVNWGNADVPGFEWNTIAGLRNTFTTARSAYFQAGDQVRLYVYQESNSTAVVQSATLSLNLITAAAVPGGGYVKPDTGIPQSDLNQYSRDALERANYAFDRTAALTDENRLGARAQSFSNGDLNNLVNTGFYGGYNLGNAPSTDAYFVEVVRVLGDANDGIGRVWQRVRGYDGDQADVTYERVYRDGLWTPWIRLSNVLGAIDQPARNLAAAAVKTVNGSAPDANGNVAVSGGGGGTLPPSISTSAQAVDYADVNTLTDSGWYSGEGMTNAPLNDGNRWVYTVLRDPALGMIEQHAYEFNPSVPAASRRSFYRQTTGDWTTGWSAWSVLNKPSAPAKSAAYTLGGASAPNNYNTQTAVVRVAVDLPKKATRLRVHINNVIGLSDFPQPNGPSINSAWFGRKNAASGANGAAQTSSQSFPASSGSLNNGGEWVSGWLVPNWDTGVEVGFLTYSANFVNTAVAFNTVANAWYANPGVAGTDLTGTGWTQYGDCPLNIWIEYEYEDDGSKTVLFVGDSIVDGYYGGPFQQTSGPMRNWIGHIDSFPMAWSRHTGNVAIVNAYASAKTTDWGSTSTKWTRFNTAATAFKPDAVVVHIGANDFFNGASAAAVAANVETVLRTTRAKYPTAKVFWVGIIPLLSTNTAVTSANRIAANSIVSQLPKWVLDGYLEPKSLYDPSAGATAEYARPKYVSPDGLHFNPEGYEALSRDINLF